MIAILDHLDQVSVFGPSSLALFLILGLDWVFSSVHAYEECRGEEAPLWRVFGAVVGFWLPNWLGFLLFTLALTLLLWCVGLAAIGGWRARGCDRGADIRYLGISLGPVSSGLSSKSGS